MIFLANRDVQRDVELIVGVGSGDDTSNINANCEFNRGLSVNVPGSLSIGCASQTVIANAAQGSSTTSSQTATDFNIVINGLVANLVTLDRQSLLS